DIRVREIWQDGYIPFTGQNTDQDVSAEIYCGDDVLHYDNWEWIDDIVSGQTYHCVAWNVWADGQISGLLYNDLNEDKVKDTEEPVLENMNVYLLTHNSPWFLRATTTTNSLGQYLFEDLSAGDYFVCQDIQTNWFQTQLNNAGLGGINIGSATPGTQIGGDPDPTLDALIAQFCYPVTLSQSVPIVANQDFGSFFQEAGFVGGVTDTRDPGEDGEVLAATGQSAWLMTALGSVLMGLALATRLVRVKENGS
ncbi:MAG TPA: SdrD B-like domain-containing protein, partial [Candidatus Saccharimonadales bacterium]